MDSNATSTSITFVLSGQALFQVTLQTGKSTTIRQVICHIVKSISMDIKQHPEVFFIKQHNDTQYAYSNQDMGGKINVDKHVGQVSGKLFYYLLKQQFEMLRCQNYQSKNRVVKQMKSIQMERKFRAKQVMEEPLPQPLVDEQKQLTVTPIISPNALQKQVPKQQANHFGQQGNESLKKDQQKRVQQVKLPQQKVSEDRVDVIMSLQTIQVQKRVPNESSFIKTQSTYFQQQPNLNTNNKQVHPMPMPLQYQQSYEANYSKVGQTNQVPITQQTQFRSQTIQTVKQDACCQLI